MLMDPAPQLQGSVLTAQTMMDRLAAKSVSEQGPKGHIIFLTSLASLEWGPLIKQTSWITR